MSQNGATLSRRETYNLLLQNTLRTIQPECGLVTPPLSPTLPPGRRFEIQATFTDGNLEVTFVPLNDE
ncbi:hypothetical protein FS749_000478 [Ceratobasidium sp. UAMH 11750]|nr:hypothetical protein FS749_000478 [Ceratobasidium sp. UAMH 11750]